jgi:hypothetical protein
MGVDRTFFGYFLALEGFIEFVVVPGVPAGFESVNARLGFPVPCVQLLYSK